MKRKQPPATPFTLKMSTTSAYAPYKEFFVSNYATGWCTGGDGAAKQCPIKQDMSVKTATDKVLSPDEVSRSANKYIYTCEWLKNGKCANPGPFGTDCLSGQLNEEEWNNFPTCNLPAPP